MDTNSPPPISNDQIRSDLVETAISFLKNPKVAKEPMEKKRAFLVKKGLTDSEIAYAFKIIPQEIAVEQFASRPSFLRRLLSDLILASLLAYAWKYLRRVFFAEKRSNLIETIEKLQTSVTKLEQTIDQLHLATLNRSNPSTTAIDEIKNEIQILKGLFLNRSQFPSIPRIPSWQIEAAEKTKSRLSDAAARTTQEDNESIVVIPDNGKKSDDEHRLSTSPSSESAGEN